MIDMVKAYYRTIDPSDYVWTIARIQRKVPFHDYEVFEGGVDDVPSFLDKIELDFNEESKLSFKEVLKDFVRRSIKYTVDTGCIMDLSGLKNIVFLKTEHGWD